MRIRKWWPTKYARVRPCSHTHTLTIQQQNGQGYTTSQFPSVLTWCNTNTWVCLHCVNSFKTADAHHATIVKNLILNSVCAKMSMYRFVKDTSGTSKRLFMQGTSDGKTLGPPIVTNFSNPDEIENLQAVYTKKRLSTEVLGSSLESTKTSRKNGDGGGRRITTRIVRKVTTLTRGEEQSLTEDLTKRAELRSHHREEIATIKAIEPKRVKVRLICLLRVFYWWCATMQVLCIIIALCNRCDGKIFLFVRLVNSLIFGGT